MPFCSSLALTGKTLTTRAATTAARKVALPSPWQASSSLSTLATRRTSVARASSPSSYRTLQTTAPSLRRPCVWKMTEPAFEAASEWKMMQIVKDLQKLDNRLYRLYKDTWWFEYADGTLMMELSPYAQWSSAGQARNRAVQLFEWGN